MSEAKSGSGSEAATSTPDFVARNPGDAWWARSTEKVSTMLRAIARYVLIAIAALIVGIVINLAIRDELSWQNFFNPVFYRFVMEYATPRWHNFFDPGLLIVLGLSLCPVSLSIRRLLFGNDIFGEPDRIPRSLSVHSLLGQLGSRRFGLLLEIQRVASE